MLQIVVSTGGGRGSRGGGIRNGKSYSYPLVLMPHIVIFLDEQSLNKHCAPDFQVFLEYCLIHLAIGCNVLHMGFVKSTF